MQPSHHIRFPSSRFLLGLGLLLGLAGCQPPEAMREAADPSPVTGQVFVVVGTGESMRLGSVQVQIFEEETIQAHIDEKDRAIATGRDELHERLAELEESASALAETKAKAEEAYRSREAEIRSELAQFIEQSEARTKFLQEEIASNSDFVAFKDSLPLPPPGIPSPEEYRLYDARREKWLTMNREERGAWVEVLTSLNAELTAEIKQLAAAREEKVFAFADELQGLDEKILAAEKSATEVDEAVEVVRKQLDETPDYAAYLEELPPSLRDVRTDADGEFSVQLPPGRRYVIFAQTERRLGEEWVKLRWFVRAGDGQPGRVLLSNHNLITSEASENVISLFSAALEQKSST